MGSNKIFVGGLGQGVNTVQLRNYFERYGEIIDCVVMIDKRTQRSRGFGLKKQFVKTLFGDEAIQIDITPKISFLALHNLQCVVFISKFALLGSFSLRTLKMRKPLSPIMVCQEFFFES
jgi:hypothetical protein